MGLADGNPFVVQTATTRVNQINFSDQRFINEWGSSWSTPLLAPIFNNTQGQNQDNRASTSTQGARLMFLHAVPVSSKTDTVSMAASC